MADKMFNSNIAIKVTSKEDMERLVPYIDLHCKQWGNPAAPIKHETPDGQISRYKENINRHRSMIRTHGFGWIYLNIADTQSSFGSWGYDYGEVEDPVINYPRYNYTAFYSVDQFIFFVGEIPSEYKSRFHMKCVRIASVEEAEVVARYLATHMTELGISPSKQKEELRLYDNCVTSNISFKHEITIMVYFDKPGDFSGFNCWAYDIMDPYDRVLAPEVDEYTRFENLTAFQFFMGIE